MNLLFAKRKDSVKSHKKLIDEVFSEENKKDIEISNETSAEDVAKIIADELIKSFQKSLHENVAVQ
jgi:hypothetical protein